MGETKRGQAGIEVLVVIGVIVVLLIPLILGIYSQMNSFNDQLNTQQADRTASQLAQAADVVSAGGAGNNLSFQVEMPKNIEEIVVSGKEIVFKVRTADGTTEVVKRTRANVTGHLNGIRAQGKYAVAIWSEKVGDTVVAEIEPI